MSPEKFAQKIKAQSSSTVSGLFSDPLIIRILRKVCLPKRPTQNAKDFVERWQHTHLIGQATRPQGFSRPPFFGWHHDALKRFPTERQLLANRVGRRSKLDLCVRCQVVMSENSICLNLMMVVKMTR